MKNHSNGNRKSGPGYRTPSTFRFEVQRRTRNQQIKNAYSADKHPFAKKG
jgi:hypothetical protein